MMSLSSSHNELVLINVDQWLNIISHGGHIVVIQYQIGMILFSVMLWGYLVLITGCFW
jgi:hypothetical protein